MIEIRPATEEDFLSFFGGKPPELMYVRAFAWAGVEGDKVLGIGGVIYHAAGGVSGFLNVGEEGRKHPVVLHRAALRMLERWRAMGYRAMRITVDRRIPCAEAWARRLGFAPLDGENGVWVWRA